MKYAIVDIGSNAIKYKIFDIDLKLVEYYRHPLRLGRDVFTKGYLEEKTIENLLNLLLEYSKIFKKSLKYKTIVNQDITLYGLVKTIKQNREIFDEF